MTTSDHLEERLGQLAQALGRRPHTAAGVMRQIEEGRHATLMAECHRRRLVWRSTLGTAAVVALAGALWFSFLGAGATLSLADVQQAVADHQWVHIRWDDGSHTWEDLTNQKSYVTYKNKSNFYAGMRDHRQGLWRYYHTNWGPIVHEERFTPDPFPRTPWEYAVGWTADATPRIVEKSTEKLEGKTLYRFDVYHAGPCGLRALAEQIWADPKARLPVRIRQYLPPEKKSPEHAFKAGEFEFPSRGPADIYELGVPNDLDVVKNLGWERAAREIREAGQKAQQAFPRNLRIIEWHDEDQPYWRVDVTYQKGNKTRIESYGYDRSLGGSGAMPRTADQVLEWASRFPPIRGLTIFDGEYVYSGNATVRVRRRPADWADALNPIRSQWACFTDVTGPMTLVVGSPDALPGCLLLRHLDPREGDRLDLHVDPEHDYICVRKTWYREEAGQWVKDDRVSGAAHGDLAQLPTGHWYARSREEHGHVRVEAQIIREEDYPKEAFDGVKPLRDAMARGVEVEFVP